MENTVDLIIFMGQSNMAGRGIADAAHPQDRTPGSPAAGAAPDPGGRV